MITFEEYQFKINHSNIGDVLSKFKTYNLDCMKDDHTDTQYYEFIRYLSNGKTTCKGYYEKNDPDHWLVSVFPGSMFNFSDKCAICISYFGSGMIDAWVYKNDSERSNEVVVHYFNDDNVDKTPEEIKNDIIEEFKCIGALHESVLSESKNGIEISTLAGKEMMGKKVKSTIRKGSKVWKKLNGGKHKINHKNTDFVPCEVVKIEKKRNDKTNAMDFWISVKTTDDSGKESYFYDWANQFMNTPD